MHGDPHRDRLGHLIRLARQAHVNLLRVWGGGLIEDDAFYAACDDAGIFVWQELSQSSSQVDSVPSADPAFVDLMRDDARAIVPARRNHPSLLLWCGGNELADERPLDETRSPVLAAVRDVVADLDPDRPFVPTSPSGPRFHNRLEDIEADSDGLWDVHGPWEHQGLDRQNVLYDAGTALLNSEFGVEGMTNRRTHEALVTPAHRWPATRDNPIYRHLGDWWINAPLVQAAFGGGIRDLETLRRASQHLQADGLRYAVEANRRRWPRNAGSLPWQLNESFPNAWCTSAIDHRGDPKAAFFGVGRAYAPIHVCARFERWAWAGAGPLRAEVWAWAGDGVPAGSTVRAAVRDMDGAPMAELTADVDGLADRARRFGVLEAELPAGDLALIDLRLCRGADGEALATNRYVVSGTADLAPLLELPPASLEATRTTVDDGWLVELAHRGGPSGLGITLADERPIDVPGWAEPDDGWFDLLPGERRTVNVRWAEAPEAGRRLRIHGWNVDAVID
jgi:beta-mannosidase